MLDPRPCGRQNRSANEAAYAEGTAEGHESVTYRKRPASNNWSDAMSNVMSPPAISMPAWWDPKNRKAVWNPHSIVPGILIISGGSIAFVTPGTAVFNRPLKETALSPRTSLEACSCSFRITCGCTTYRLYLIAPQGAPKLSKDHVEEIGITLQTASAAGALIGGSIASVTEVFGFIGDAVEAFTATASLVKARKNYKLLQQLMTGAG